MKIIDQPAQNLANASSFGMPSISQFWLLIPLVLAIMVCLLVIASLDASLVKNLYWSVQGDWFLYLNRKLAVLPHFFWSNVTLLGEAVVLLPIMALLTISRKQVWLTIIYTAPVASIFSVALKRLTAIPRPAAVLEADQITIIGQTFVGKTSLPSGHTITIFAASIALLITLYPSLKKNQERRIILILLIISTVISLSRVAVGAHWPLDLVLGAACGWFAGYLGACIAKKNDHNWLHSPKSCLCAAFIFLLWGLVLIQRAANSSLNESLLWVAACCAVVTSVALLKQRKNSSIDHE